MLFKNADGAIETKYINLQEKMDIENERKIERQVEILKRNPNPLAESKKEHRKTRRKKEVKKISKKLNDVREKNKKVKDELGINYKRRLRLPGKIEKG